MSSLLSDCGTQLCEYFRSHGCRCVESNLGHHLHWCNTCSSLVRQHGSMVTCDKQCVRVHHNIRFDNPKPSQENAFNPVVRKWCRECDGAGFKFSQFATDSCLATPCAECSSAGTTLDSLYAESESIDVFVDEKGWTRCPKCGFRFKASDAHAMAGFRHGRCGQRLRIVVGPNNALKSDARKTRAP